MKVQDHIFFPFPTAAMTEDDEGLALTDYKTRPIKPAFIKVS